MPFADRDVPDSGRSSRASQLSGSHNPPRGNAGDGDMFSAPGVLSMLKTSTDTGDIGALSFNKSRLPVVPRPAHNKRSTPSYMSDISHHTSHSHGPSQSSNKHHVPGAWETRSVGPRSSFTSLRTTKTMPPYLSDEILPPPPAAYTRDPFPYGPSPAPSSDSRSFSMTRSHPHRPLTMQRSVSSLRSQGTAPSGPPPRAPPYMYPPRFKRPGYRSPSPALSDYSVAPPPPPQGRHIHRPPLNSYYSDSAHGAASSHPLPPYPQGPPRHMPMMAHPQLHPLPMHRAPPVSQQRYPYDNGQYVYREPYRPPPSPHMTRYYQGPAYPAVPPRVYTPRVDSVPSSSEPGSSAPPSSNPPTPRDATPSHAAVEPTLVEQGSGELPLDPSVQVAYQRYADYVESGEKAYELEAEPVEIHELDSLHLQGNQSFVQRMKVLLNQRTAAASPPASVQQPFPARPPPAVPAPIVQLVAPPIVAEMPASPVKLATTSTEVEQVLSAPRITRAMITAIVAPSSEQGTSSMDGSKTIDSDHRMGTDESKDSASLPSSDRDDDSIRDHSVHLPTAKSSSGSFRSNDTPHLTASDYAVRIEVPTVPTSVDAQAVNVIKTAVTPQVMVQVSPVKSEDDGDRDSVVSPVPTPTIEVATPQQSDASPSRRTEQKLTQPSPRAKSLAIPRGHSAAFASRRSLPPDLNHHEEATASEIVTDIAVRFSLPRQSHIGKPQLVHVPASAEPTLAKSEDMLHREIFELPETVSPRESMYSVDPVAPLQVNKITKDVAAQVAGQGADLSSFIRRSYPRRQSVWSNDSTGKRNSTDSATDTRHSVIQSGPGHLPRLKEESCEDIPTAALRISDFHFPVPRAATATGGTEPTKPSHLPKSNTSASQRPGISLSELAKLPSLNFSRLNLVDQLNGALSKRSSRSMDVGRHRKPSEIVCPSPMRPASTEALRERYTSFFAKPEDFHVPDPAEETASFSIDILSGGHSERQSELELVQHETQLPRAPPPSISGSNRPLSPEELLGVVADVNRLSVPSVAGLSDRLSELMPSLKRLHLNSAVADDDAVNNTIDEIHHLGERPNTMISVRSSGGLRQMAAAADNIVTNGTHDSAALELKARLMKSLPPLPDDTKTSVADSVLGPRPASSYDGTSTEKSLPELPKPARLRAVSENNMSDVRPLLAVAHCTSANSGIPTITSQPSSRPWNNDDNYPWVSDDIAINIGYPPEAHCRDSDTSEVFHHATKPSTVSADLNITENDMSTTALSSVSELDPTATVTADTMTGFGRKLSRRSLLGSFSRKIGLPSPARPKVSFEGSGRTSRSHNAGDRYPSTALDPGLNFNIDEARSFFSEDSSHREERRGSFRKHFSQLRSRIPPTILITRATSTSLDNELRHSMVYERQGHCQNSGSTLRVGAESSADTFSGTVGMGKMEFRVKRVAERLRHLWTRGHNMLRSLSQRGSREKRQQEREEWLEDSLYSGT